MVFVAWCEIIPPCKYLCESQIIELDRLGKAEQGGNKQ